MYRSILLFLVFALALCSCATSRRAGLAPDILYCIGDNESEVPAHIRAERGVEFTRYKHRRLLLDLFYPDAPPDDGVAYPLVVHVHGGGWWMGSRSTGGGVPEIVALVENGFAVASVDYRLAPDDAFPAPIEDLESALRFLAREGERLQLHTERVGLFGTSAGAHIAMVHLWCDRDVEPYSDCFCEPTPIEVVAFVDFFGPTDIEELLVGPKRLIGPSVFGSAGPGREGYRTWSPAQIVSSPAPPTLVVQGAADRLVPREQSDMLVEALRDAGVETRYLVVSSAGHALRRAGSEPDPPRHVVTRTVVEFLEEMLVGTLNEEDAPNDVPVH